MKKKKNEESNIRHEIKATPNGLIIKRYKGFSFMESMIAVTVLSMGIIASLSLISSSFRESADSRDQIMASLLAQEGVELVQNIRDNNWVRAGSGVDSFSYNLDITNPLNSANCRIDKDFAYGTDILECGQGGYLNTSDNYRLYLNAAGYYVHDSGDETRFYRKICNAGNANVRLVYSIVSWDVEATNDLVADCTLGTISQNCVTANKCAWARVVLTKWGGYE